MRALSSGWELPDINLISLAIEPSIVKFLISSGTSRCLSPNRAQLPSVGVCSKNLRTVGCRVSEMIYGVKVQAESLLLSRQKAKSVKANNGKGTCCKQAAGFCDCQGDIDPYLSLWKNLLNFGWSPRRELVAYLNWGKDKFIMGTSCDSGRR